MLARPNVTVYFRVFQKHVCCELPKEQRRENLINLVSKQDDVR